MQINENTKIVSAKFEIPNSNTLEVAKQHGAYNAIDKAFTMDSQEIIKIVSDSNLRGKGGGGGHAGTKWGLMPCTEESDSVVVVNSDESEPGTFKDRQIISKDPHLLIEGIIIACWAVKAHDAYIYIRGEYKPFIDKLDAAIEEAYAAGILGENACGKGFRVDITAHRGGGAYVCGEKSALLESLEGKRGHPRLKPKGKEPEWYFGRPTLLSNVETFSTVPFLINHGAEGYHKLGTEKSPGTLLFQISGHVNKPGVYEMPFGMKMIDFINNIAGGVKDGKKLKAVIPGGVSTAVLTAKEAEQVTLDYEAMWDFNTELGTGGMIVMDEDTDMVKALKNILEFYEEESCGQCTPCRDGSGWSDRMIGKMLAGEGKMEDFDKIQEVSDSMNGKTICLFGPSISSGLNSYIGKFRDEFEAYIKQGENK